MASLFEQVDVSKTLIKFYANSWVSKRISNDKISCFQHDMGYGIFMHDIYSIICYIFNNKHMHLLCFYLFPLVFNKNNITTNFSVGLLNI